MYKPLIVLVPGLLLTRGVGEKLKIGDNVTVTVVEFKGGQICIGIDAPREIQVDREEWLHLQSSGRSVCMTEGI